MAEAPARSTTALEDGGPERSGRLTRAREKGSQAARVSWSIYQQVGAVFTAFGVLAMIGHFWDIGLRGFIATVVGVWGQTIRPAMTFLCRMIVTEPLSWFGIGWEVPLPARDYVSVGLILGHSTAWEYRPRNVRGLLASLVAVASGRRLTMLATYVAFWPVYLSIIPSTLADIEDGGYQRGRRRLGLRALSDLVLVCWSVAAVVVLAGGLALGGNNVVVCGGVGSLLLVVNRLSIFAVRGTYGRKRFLMGLSLNGSLVALVLAVAFLPSLMLTFLVASALALPSALLLLGLIVASRRPETRAEAHSVARILSPLFFLAVLLAVNYLVLGGLFEAPTAPPEILSFDAGETNPVPHAPT